MAKPDGGPTFPRTAGINGVSLRDYFAAKAMAAYAHLAGFSGSPNDEAIASYAYHIADAMIAEREKGDE